MKNIHEAVALPDAASHPLVHPLDLADARKPFVVAWWLSVLTLPTVFFALAAMLWSISNNYVTPILVPIVVIAGSVFARRYLESEAWAHIPRKRQDRGRQLPVVWSIVKAAISALALLFGLVLVILWLVRRELPADVTAYIVGMGAGVVGLMLLNLLWTVLAPTRLTGEVGGWVPQLISLVVVAAALGYGYLVLREHSGAESWKISDIVIGAAIIIGVQVVWWLSRLWPARKRHHTEETTAE
ncbi:MAG: hypothetical protein ACTH2Q_01825 [Propionibacteriaceae bacterium]